jgi:hypothetical protein
VATVSCTLPSTTTTTSPVPTVTATSGGLLAEALLGYPVYAKTTAGGPATLYAKAAVGPATPAASADVAGKSRENNNNNNSNDDLPLGASFETAGLGSSLGSLSPASNNEEPVNIELDNAGRVKSGKVCSTGVTSGMRSKVMRSKCRADHLRNS